MKQADYDRFVDALNAVADIVDKRRPTEVAIAMYWKLLEPYDIDAVTGAITRHLKNTEAGMFMPKPADIVREIEGGSDERSLLAWTKLEQAVEQCGPWRVIVFDDPRIHAVVEEMGGYMVFCRATNDQWPFLRNEFCKRYRPYIQKPPHSFPAMLSAEGGFKQNPVFIGDEKKASLVMANGGARRSSVSIREAITGAAQQLEHQS